MFKVRIIPNFKKGMQMEKYSKQREEVLEVLRNSYDHPTAEEIFQAVKQKDETVSRGTVYRNLGILTQKGMVQQIPISNSPDRYDLKRIPHWHVICKKCGKVVDFEDYFEEEQLKKQVKEKTGMEMISSEIILHGICNECVQKKEE